MSDIGRRVSDKIIAGLERLEARYWDSLPSYTPKHERFRCHLFLQLGRVAENLRKHECGEPCDIGEWFFDTYDLVNALALVKVMEQDKNAYSLIEEACEALCASYDEVVNGQSNE